LLPAAGGDAAKTRLYRDLFPFPVAGFTKNYALRASIAPKSPGLSRQ
jgi:hypothetical protein